jgi:hypothetical protein
MKRFIIDLLPDLVNGARTTFEKFRSVHAAYGKGEMPYATWIREIIVGRGIWGERESEEKGDEETHGEYSPEG